MKDATTPAITGRTNDQLVGLLLEHGVPAKFWPRTLGRPVFVEAMSTFFWIRPACEAHP